MKSMTEEAIHYVDMFLDDLQLDDTQIEEPKEMLEFILSALYYLAPVENGLSARQLTGEIAAIWARLYADRPDDAMEMARILTNEDLQTKALAEMYADDERE